MLSLNAPIWLDKGIHTNGTFIDLLGLTKEDPNAKILLPFNAMFATALTSKMPFYSGMRSCFGNCMAHIRETG